MRIRVLVTGVMAVMLGGAGGVASGQGHLTEAPDVPAVTGTAADANDARPCPLVDRFPYRQIDTLGGAVTQLAVADDRLVLVEGGNVVIATIEDGDATVHARMAWRPWLDAVTGIDVLGDQVLLVGPTTRSLGAQGELVAIDIAVPSRPRLRLQRAIPGRPADVGVSGGRAYVASWEHGLLIFAPGAQEALELSHEIADRDIKTVGLGREHGAILGFGGTIDLFDPRISEPAITETLAGATIDATAMALRGSYLYVGRYDAERLVGVVDVYDVAQTPRRVASVDVGDPVRQMMVDAGRLLVTTGFDDDSSGRLQHLRLVDGLPAGVVQTISLEHAVWDAAAFGNEVIYLALAQHGLAAVDAERFDVRLAPADLGRATDVRAMTTTPDGAALAVAGGVLELYALDAASAEAMDLRQIIRLEPEIETEIDALAAHPTSPVLLAATDDGQLRLLEVGSDGRWHAGDSVSATAPARQLRVAETGLFARLVDEQVVYVELERGADGTLRFGPLTPVPLPVEPQLIALTDSVTLLVASPDGLRGFDVSTPAAPQLLREIPGVDGELRMLEGSAELVIGVAFEGGEILAGLVQSGGGVPQGVSRQRGPVGYVRALEAVGRVAVMGGDNTWGAYHADDRGELVEIGGMCTDGPVAATAAAADVVFVATRGGGLEAYHRAFERRTVYRALLPMVQKPRQLGPCC